MTETAAIAQKLLILMIRSTVCLNEDKKLLKNHKKDRGRNGSGLVAWKGITLFGVA
jgi:hypothetical protein